MIEGTPTPVVQPGLHAAERSSPSVELSVAERISIADRMIHRFKQTVAAKFPRASGISLVDSEGEVWDVDAIISRKTGEIYGLSMHAGVKPKAIDYQAFSHKGENGREPSGSITSSDWSGKEDQFLIGYV